MPATSTLTIENFIARWKASGASERASYQLFLTELCELLDVEKPMPTTAQELILQFKPVAKSQQTQRLQQINSLLQTLFGLGLLRKSEQEQYVKYHYEARVGA